jgi:glycerophosphoryl diester phosphodiesterase
MEITFHGHSLHNGIVHREDIEQKLKLGCHSFELDISLNSKGELIIAHDSEDAEKGESLGRVLDLFVEHQNNTSVLLELKTDDKTAFDKLKDAILSRGLQKNITIYADPKIARSFPWNKSREVPLGIIEPYPWRIAATIATYKPDYLMTGWIGKNYTQWSSLEKLVVKKLWKILNLPAKLAGSPTRLILATIESPQDLRWAKQQGIFEDVLTEDIVLEKFLSFAS